MRFRPEATGYNMQEACYWDGEMKIGFDLYKVCGPLQKPTYAELKQDVKSWLKDGSCKVVKVIRSRRGEWGEWYETWKLVDGKPTIVNETWM